MKKLLLAVLTYIFFVNGASAQYFLGLRSSNWGGVTNVDYNPAIADSRYVVDINLVGAGFNFNNNYLGIDRKVLMNPSSFNSDNIQANFKENVQGNPLLNPYGNTKRIFIGAQVQGPLSFMFSFGKYNKNAIAFTYHLNSVTNVDGIGEPLARLAYYGLGGTGASYFGTQFSNQKLAFNSMSWMDYGITYSRVLYDKGAHMFKAGVTLKVVQGIGAAYMYSSNLQYKFKSKDTLSINNSDLSYGVTSNYNFGSDDYNFSFNFKDASLAADFGAVYEWRPNKDKYKYEMDGKDDWYRRDKNLYLIQAGFAMVDIGAVNFSRLASTQNFYANITDWNIKNFQVTGVNSITDTINSRFSVTSNTRLLKMWLPTHINLWVDAQAGAGFGFTASTAISTILVSSKNQVHQVTTLAITPHYDIKWFGAYLPFSYDAYNNVNLGLTLRVGPLIIGTQDILGFFAKKFVRDADIHFALKVPIPYRMPRDKDHDHVSNRKDKCPKEPGPWATRGCPDRDGDGVLDKDDRCPDVPGPAMFNGCPDTDGDSIPDIDDSCPTVKGLIQFHGCPDTDGDGIPDKDDLCPTVPGLAQFNGCPDTDGDGVPDKDDLCPTVPGPKEHHGCPDTDGDGVYDNEDSCVTVAGPVENHGCPWPDSDGDGVPDKDDQCPHTAGPASNHGCPVLEKKEIETIKYAFDNLEFETGKDVIRTHSYPSLNSLADLLTKKKDYGLRIDGHTDNVGGEEKNMALSLKRAEAVKTYLTKHGVDPSKLETHGYGMTKPIADNKTAAGRQKNRRVEMNIFFK